MPVVDAPRSAAADVIDTLRSQRQLLVQWGVVHLDLFGSVARGDADPGSDVDILVTFGGTREKRGFARVAALEDVRDALSDALNRRVDVTCPTALDPALRDRIAVETVRAF